MDKIKLPRTGVQSVAAITPYVKCALQHDDLIRGVIKEIGILRSLLGKESKEAVISQKLVGNRSPDGTRWLTPGLKPQKNDPLLLRFLDQAFVVIAAFNFIFDAESNPVSGSE